MISQNLLIVLAIAPLVGALIAGLLRNQVGRAGAVGIAIVSVAILEFVNDPSQPGAVQRVRLTTTLVQRDGGWVIAQAHASAVS